MTVTRILTLGLAKAVNGDTLASIGKNFYQRD